MFPPVFQRRGGNIIKGGEILDKNQTKGGNVSGKIFYGVNGPGWLVVGSQTPRQHMSGLKNKVNFSWLGS